MWLLNSSIGRKLIMSLSGLFLIVFLLIHLGANLGLLVGPSTYNAICHFMDTNPVIQVMVPILALGFVVHIAFAFWLTLQNRKARGTDRYASSGKTDITWASQNMLVLGVIVLGFLALHLTHFWAKMQFQHFIGGEAEADAYGLAVELFTNPVYSALYIVWIVALWYHLTHGFWSAFQTVGLNSNIWFPRWKCISYIYATVVAVGYIIIPLFFLLGLGEGACDAAKACCGGH